MSWYWSRCACVTILFFLFIQSLPSIVICFVFFVSVECFLYDFFSYMERMSCYCTKSCWTDLSSVTNWPPVFCHGKFIHVWVKISEHFPHTQSRVPPWFWPCQCHGDRHFHERILNLSNPLTAFSIFYHYACRIHAGRRTFISLCLHHLLKAARVLANFMLNILRRV